MTNGVFLEQLVNNFEMLNQITHIILDEVHERDINSDFIMLTLKHLLGNFCKVKLIIMSATLQPELFQRYFSEDEINQCSEQKYYPDCEPQNDLEEKWLKQVAGECPWANLKDKGMFGTKV